MDNNGWIKLHRKFLDWEWYSDIVTKTVFLHLLLTANHEQKRWQGKVIERGQKVTTREGLAAQLGLSVQQVRTAWEKLERTGEITRKSTSEFTLITICKYEDYQQMETNEQPTSNQQSTNEQPTINHKQEYKKERIIYDVVDTCVYARKPIEDYMQELSTEQNWIEQICMNNHISLTDFEKRVQQFILECKCNGKETADSTNDAKSHFQNWLRIRLNAEKKQNKNGESSKSNIERAFGIDIQDAINFGN